MELHAVITEHPPSCYQKFYITLGRHHSQFSTKKGYFTLYPSLDKLIYFSGDGDSYCDSLMCTTGDQYSDRAWEKGPLQ